MATSAAFYVVYIKRNTSASFEDVKKKMDQSLDWYRVEETLWILYTTSDAEKWYARLSALVKESGNLFICKLDTTVRQGWMNKDFWSWFEREKPET
jgi:hypothetical protein